MKATKSINQYCRLVGSGAALPEVCISNTDLAKRLAKLGVETSDTWIKERTGIESRYFAAPEQKTSDLAAIACKRALEHANITAHDIELIIVATSTPDMIFPSTACHVQQKLGIVRCAAFDIQAVCAGFVYAVNVADSMMKARGYRHALVVGAETFSHILDWRDRSTCVLFGDGAGALVLSLEENLDEQPRGIIDCEVNAEGRHSTKLCVPGHVNQGSVTGDPFLRMDGQSVFKFAVNCLVECAEILMKRTECSAEDIDWFVPHQANKRIMSAISKKISIPDERVISMVHEHANTSAASIPLALASGISEGKVKKDDTLLMVGVGGGFTWGGLIATWD